MRAMGPGAQLAAAMREAGAQVQAAVDGLSEEQMSRPAINGWSVKDHLNHLTVWHEFRFYEISRIARGGQTAFSPMSDEQVELLNAFTVELRRHLPVAQTVADLEFARSLVMEAMATAPEEALRDDRYGEVGLSGGIAHDLEHAATIRAWRQKEGI